MILFLYETLKGLRFLMVQHMCKVLHYFPCMVYMCDDGFSGNRKMYIGIIEANGYITHQVMAVLRDL